MCKFGAHRNTPTAKVLGSRGDIFAMANLRRVSGFWRFLGKYLGTGPKIPYWEPTGENPWISGPEDIPTLINLDEFNRDSQELELEVKAPLEEGCCGWVGPV